MRSECFSTLEIDAIGEILNISLGSSATAVSTLLNTRVDITTPVVTVVDKDEFQMDRVEPAVGVEITYVEGLDGSNVMLLKRHDVKSIVEMLMGMEMSDEEFELNEINISAVCEVMNQMMGASATALSEFLGKTVNISTPVSFEVENEQEFIEKYFVDDQPKVVVGFRLSIQGKLESEFFNVMPIELAKGLVRGILPEEEILPVGGVQETPKEEPKVQEAVQESAPAASGGKLSQEEIEKLLQGGLADEQPAQAPTPEPVPVPTPTPMQQTPVAPTMPAAESAPVAPVAQMAVQPGVSPDVSMMQMQMMQQMMQQMQQMQQAQQQMMQMEGRKKSEPKMINVQTAVQPNLVPDKEIILEGEQEENMELIMGVPLEISVEIGRTRKLVKDILDFSKGSLVVLDKLAGEQVDLFVNGQCIAKGDVVVVEDNFGIRITEIMKLNIASLE